MYNFIALLRALNPDFIATISTDYSCEVCDGNLKVNTVELFKLGVRSTVDGDYVIYTKDNEEIGRENLAEVFPRPERKVDVVKLADSVKSFMNTMTAGIDFTALVNEAINYAVWKTSRFSTGRTATWKNYWFFMIGDNVTVSEINKESGLIGKDLATVRI